ncbi:710_t:CDS:2 [Gigaspora rosea]|nr:710_t:CDS:2 [Gigaspora rosea]
MDTSTIAPIIIELSSKEPSEVLIDSKPYELNKSLENKIRKTYQKLLTSTRSRPRRVQTLFYAYCLGRLIEEELPLLMEHIMVWNPYNLYTEPVSLI